MISNKELALVIGIIDAGKAGIEHVAMANYADRRIQALADFSKACIAFEEEVIKGHEQQLKDLKEMGVDSILSSM